MCRSISFVCKRRMGCTMWNQFRSTFAVSGSMRRVHQLHCGTHCATYRDCKYYINSTNDIIAVACCKYLPLEITDAQSTTASNSITSHELSNSFSIFTSIINPNDSSLKSPDTFTTNCAIIHPFNNGSPSDRFDDINTYGSAILANTKTNI